MNTVLLRLSPSARSTSLRQIRVPALLIQPLVENAIKHGVAPCRAGGEVVILARLARGAGDQTFAATAAEQTLRIWVRDTGVGASERGLARGRARGIGLRNVEQRIKRHSAGGRTGGPADFPQVLARRFSTHPMTSDRIKEVGNLVARFPDKQEYEISSSEFDSVKSRLISINAARRPADERNGRPTLKRRPVPASDDGGSSEQPPDRPTLKRGDSSGPTDESGQESEKSECPTLKRRSDANPNPDHE